MTPSSPLRLLALVALPHWVRGTLRVGDKGLPSSQLSTPALHRGACLSASYPLFLRVFFFFLRFSSGAFKLQSCVSTSVS